MQIGYRVIRPSDVGTQDLPFVQISLWREAHWGVADGEPGIIEAIAMAADCRRRGIRQVFHPLEYPLASTEGERTMSVLRRLAASADLGIIIHDEGGEGRERLDADGSIRYEQRLREASRLCHLSIENSFNSTDILWFWERFVLPQDGNVSITVDIGHLESAGMDAITFARDLPVTFLDRIRFVHMHHKGGERWGVVDHWPLERGCREIEALRVLLERKRDLLVILELDALHDGVRESARLLQQLTAGDGEGG
jgi:sugar phosphate isomerase/epimerase